MKKHLKRTWKILQSAGNDFGPDNCYSYSAALSFYTLFSIAPILLISIYVAGIFADDVNFQQEVIAQFESLIGTNGAQGVEVLLDNLENEDQSTFQLIVGIVVLIITATNIFIQMQSGFNNIYQVQPREGKAILKQVIDRAISLGMILSLGFVLIISLILDSLIITLKNSLGQQFGDITVNLLTLTENLILLAIIGGIIYALFHFLPDVRIPKRFKFRASAILATLLFIGKFGISWYIGNSRFSELGGASASIIILMLWVFYSSIILFFGAELIKGMSKVNDVHMRASHYAKKVKTVTVDKDET